ncbi:hypothetical protein DN410_12815 [Bacillus sp. SH5-2]|nr:hypothetical protein DN410_12815 [Bacillus sp. SH5-2]
MLCSNSCFFLSINSTSLLFSTLSILVIVTNSIFLLITTFAEGSRNHLPFLLLIFSFCCIIKIRKKFLNLKIEKEGWGSYYDTFKSEKSTWS